MGSKVVIVTETSSIVVLTMSEKTQKVMLIFGTLERSVEIKVKKI